MEHDYSDRSIKRGSTGSGIQITALITRKEAVMERRIVQDFIQLAIKDGTR